MLDILIIDDDPAFGELLLQRLEGSGYRVDFHQGPFGSLNAVRARTPRLLIVDVNMPGLQGGSVVDLLRSHPEFAKTRVLLMSSLDQAQIDALVRAHRADAGLTKSATRAEVLAVIERLLARRA